MRRVSVVWTGSTGGYVDAVDLLLGLVRASTGETAGAVGRHCSRCGSTAHGRPVLLGVGAGLEVSLSRAAGLLVVALSSAGPVGVDAESVHEPALAEVAGQLLHPGEFAGSARETAVLWTRKEALVKAAGLGLRTSLTALRVSPAREPARLLGWLGPDAPGGEVWMADLRLGPAHAGCVAVLGSPPESVSVSEAGRAALPG